MKEQDGLLTSFRFILYRYLTQNPFFLEHSLSGANFIDRDPKEKCLLKNKRPKELFPLLLAPSHGSFGMQLPLFWRWRINFHQRQYQLLLSWRSDSWFFPAEFSPLELVGQDLILF